jgi:hypothetical protein
MKQLLIAVLLLSSGVALAREGTDPRLNLVRGQAVASWVQREPLPADLNFGAGRLEVLHANWFRTVFGCSSELAEQKSLNLQAAGPHRLTVLLDNQPVSSFKKIEADYVPLHYVGRALMHPAFVLTLAPWHLQMEIHRDALNGKKTLDFYLIQGAPGEQQLLPIAQATEI